MKFDLVSIEPIAFTNGSNQTINPIIFFSLIGGLFSLLAGILLLSREKSAKVLAEYATPLAAIAVVRPAPVRVLATSLAPLNSVTAA